MDNKFPSQIFTHTNFLHVNWCTIILKYLWIVLIDYYTFTWNVIDNKCNTFSSYSCVCVCVCIFSMIFEMRKKKMKNYINNVKKLEILICHLFFCFSIFFHFLFFFHQHRIHERWKKISGDGTLLLFCVCVW